MRRARQSSAILFGADCVGITERAVDRRFGSRWFRPLIASAMDSKTSRPESTPTREGAPIRNPTSARLSRLGALAIGTATLALAGCGGSSSTSSSPTATHPPTATITTETATATSSTGTSTAAIPGAAQFNMQAAPLLDSFYAADREYTAVCCRGTNYDAEANAVRGFEAASRTFIDGLMRLTPPPSAAAALQKFTASLRADLVTSRKILTAVLAHDRAAIRAVIHSPGAYSTASLDAVLAALGVQNNDVVGYWDGTVTQHGPGTKTLSYFMEMTVKGTTPGAIVGTIDYPSLHCGGQLQLRSAQGILHVYRELITSGRQQCSTGATIYATALGGALAWRWVATGIVVVGELDHLQRPGA
jgi:hypothetical protein